MLQFSRHGRSAALALAGAIVLATVAPGVASAAQSVSKVRISGAECEAAMAASGESARKACYVIVQSGGGTQGVAMAAACYVPPSYTHCGSTWVKSQSILLLWSVTATATYVRNSSTGKVSWTSVTCTQSAIGYTVTITWCGSYHSGLPDTNYGSNFDVSFIWKGSPITVSHGMRASVNGYTGSSCCLQSW
ncbi:MAG: hypothetical protein A2V84_08945 [Chloroflexi bacterium RBG_16_70_13]|nr:MAG: hypothetical protein A2V84_08945 [Chloroflexi bacterium RBG_16_70_13]